MADISVTAANVVKGTGNPSHTTGVAGATITAGQALYADGNDGNKLKPADNDVSSATSTVVGIALNGAAANQLVSYMAAGNIVIGGTVAVGSTYVLSSTAGGICPVADLNTGDWLCHLGYGLSTTVLFLDIKFRNVQIP